MSDDGLKDQAEVPVPPLPDAEREPTPEEIQAQFQHRVNIMFAEILAALQVWAPQLTQDEAMEVAQRMVKEQLEGIPQILQGTVVPDQVAKYPTLQITIVNRVSKVAVNMQASKRFEHIADPQAAALSACMFALLKSPEARALLRAFGFDYTFAQTPQPAAGKIIIPS